MKEGHPRDKQRTSREARAVVLEPALDGCKEDLKKV